MEKIISIIQKTICAYLSLALIIICVITGLPVDAQALMIEKKATAHQINKQEQEITNIPVTELEEMRGGEGQDPMIIVLAVIGLLVVIGAMVAGSSNSSSE